MPKEWQTWNRENHKGRGRSQSSAPRPVDRIQNFAKRPEFEQVKEEQPSDKEDQDEHNDRHREDDRHPDGADEKGPRLRSRHRRHRSRSRRRTHSGREEGWSPRTTTHQPLGGMGPGGPPPGPGGAPSSSSGQSAVATLLINIGAALALEQAKWVSSWGFW